MIKYEDIIKRIANIEKKKIKNEERIKALSDENNILTANLKCVRLYRNDTNDQIAFYQDRPSLIC